MILFSSLSMIYVLFHCLWSLSHDYSTIFQTGHFPFFFASVFDDSRLKWFSVSLIHFFPHTHGMLCMQFLVSRISFLGLLFVTVLRSDFCNLHGVTITIIFPIARTFSGIPRDVSIMTTKHLMAGTQKTNAVLIKWLYHCDRPLKINSALLTLLYT
jgi:hypothetical protein